MSTGLTTTTRYSTVFTTTASLYAPTPEVLNEVCASLDQMKGLLPAGIDPEKDMRVVYVVGNLAVAGVLNANDDAVTAEGALGMYRQFEGQQCNIEHNRKQVVGYIVKAGLSELGTNRLITDDEARASGQPFNIVTVAALWRVVNPDLCDFIIQASAPGSPDKDSLSLSFEVGFNDYSVCVLPPGTTNLSQASRIISDEGEEFDQLSALLRINKGSGKVAKAGGRVGRILGGTLVPLGQGVVTVPAAAVKGLIPILSSPGADAGEDTDLPAETGGHLYGGLAQVYTNPTDSTMSDIAKANRVRIPAGLAEKAKGLNYPKANVTLSDGRVLKGVTVFSGEELDLDSQLDSLKGVVITDMTPFVNEPQVDDSPNVHPHVGQEYPTQRPEARLEDAAREAAKKVSQNLPYTDASVDVTEVVAAFKRFAAICESLSRNIDALKSGVSTSQTLHSTPQSHSSMKLEDLNQIRAKLETATKPEEIKEALASVSLFAEAIMSASEKYAKAAKDAEDEKKKADDDAKAAKADLAEARKLLSEIQAAQASAQAETKFQDRMTVIASEVELDDEARAYVIEDIKACVDDAAFDKYLARAKKLFKTGKNKKTPDDNYKGDKKDGKKAKNDADSQADASSGSGKDADDDKAKDDDKDDDKDTAASVAAAKTAIASAAAHPTDKLDLDPVSVAAGVSLTEQYRQVFAAGVSVGGRKLSDLITDKK